MSLASEDSDGTSIDLRIEMDTTDQIKKKDENKDHAISARTFSRSIIPSSMLSRKIVS